MDDSLEISNHGQLMALLRVSGKNSWKNIVLQNNNN